MNQVGLENVVISYVTVPSWMTLNSVMVKILVSKSNIVTFEI